MKPKQHVMKPNRLRGSCTHHILDLIITNDDSMIDEIIYLSPLGKSDHSVLTFECKCDFLPYENIDKLNYDKGDYVSLRLFMNRDWKDEFSDLYPDVNSCWIKFKNILSEGVDKYIPKVKSMIWKKKASWKRPVNGNFKKLIRKKHRLWSRYRETQNSELEKEYKKMRNVVRSESRRVEQMEQKLVANSCKENPKKIWKFVKSTTSTVSDIGNIKIIDNNRNTTILTDDEDKSNAFADFFDKIYTKDKSDHVVTFDSPPAINSCPDVIIDKLDIFNKLASLKIENHQVLTLFTQEFSAN
jgi:hypothetical protein